MPFADPVRMQNRIREILNASSTWGVATTDKKRSEDGITAAKIESGFEVLRAISESPKNGHHGALATLVTVAHNAFLPAHDGKPGIPVIVPFVGAQPMDGEVAEPGEIDSWRLPAASVYYTGAYSGVGTAHDTADPQGLPSQVSARFSIVNKRFKFTGLSAQVPLIQLTRAMAENSIPEAYEPTVIKLTIPKLIKPGDALYTIAGQYGALGKVDLLEIERGALIVSPVPDVSTLQKTEAL